MFYQFEKTYFNNRDYSLLDTSSLSNCIALLETVFKKGLRLFQQKTRI